MNASVRSFPVKVTAGFCAEARAVLPLVDALDEYAAYVHDMTDEQLAREVARVEALPGSGYRRLANDEADRRTARDWAALLASMAPAGTWGWSR